VLTDLADRTKVVGRMRGMRAHRRPGLSGGLSKDSLLQQAKGLLGDLTSMKSSGEKSQVDTARLRQMANDLGDRKKQVGALTNVMK